MAKLTLLERPACYLMSDLFLDTKITGHDINRIAKDLWDLRWPAEMRKVSYP